MMKLNAGSALPRALFFVLAALQSPCSPSARAAEESFGATPVTGAKVAAASKDGELAIKKFRITPGLQAELWAAEPLVANIVSFHFSDQGDCYVVETFRHSDGVTDIRSHMDWLDEELASRSVEERVAIMKRHEGTNIVKYTRMSDRVRKVWDSSRSGRADKATVFSDGYNAIPDGLAAGVLAWRGSVYFANIPHLWKLEDSSGSGMATQKQPILSGFGVRVGFLGHDLHGLTVGPDGKLYFTIGDRGAHVVTADGRTVSNPETGAFYRCNFDGTGLEIVASGLRNPQEIAFDEFGNWFTGDNNSDGGDPARWVQLLEGGDSGWRIGYQFLDQPNSRGPWIAEKMCYPQGEGQPAYINPPIANIANGPSGLTYYPGTGLPDRFQHHFFLCDFTGGQGSKVHTFALQPKGAGFEMIDRNFLISEVLCTDVDFGPDGGIYVSDWVQGWDKTGKGRIYRLFDPTKTQDPARLEVQSLLGSTLSTRPASELLSLLGHADQRIRLRAQFALVDQGDSSVSGLQKTLKGNHPLLSRVHAIWGLGQLHSNTRSGSVKKSIVSSLEAALKDADPEIRGQSAKALGEAGSLRSSTKITGLLTDAQPRTRFLAAMALAKLKQPGASGSFLQLARENISHDANLRHASVIGLTGLKEESALLAAAKDPAVEVRRVALLALRRLESPRIEVFLSDTEEDLVTEAARAISDLPIAPALPKLAALDPSRIHSQPLWRRVVNANYRIGTAESAARLAQLSVDTKVPAAIRTEALMRLAEFSKPSGRDPVTGLWRPLTPRDAGLAKKALSPQLPVLLKQQPAPVMAQAARIAAQWNQPETGDALFSLLGDTAAPADARREALKALATLKDSRLPQAITLAKADSQEVLRKEATKLQGESGDSSGLAGIESSLEKGSLGEKQAALAALGGIKSSAADSLLATWMDRLLAGNVPGELQLDLLEAAGKRKDAAVQSKLTRFNESRKKDDSIGDYRECLTGGDAAAGKKIFLERADVSCVRCHKIRGEGGEVGPELTGVGSRNPRDYILESIVAPNRKIAQGFETVLVTLKDGSAYAGQLKKETDTELEINSSEDGLVHVKKAQIASRERGLSGMPEELRQMLSKQDLRNLVEFLATTK